MPRWLLTLSALSALIGAVLLAVVQPGDPGGRKALAHVITATPDYTSTPSNERPLLHMELDMNVANGSGPCDRVDDQATHGYNDTYQVAVCVTGLTHPVAEFYVAIEYDQTLNLVPERPNVAPALDDNPDANAGTTTWPPGSNGLGLGWDCYLGEGADPPMGDAEPDPGVGVAYIQCHSSYFEEEHTFELGDGETAGVLAMINFEAQGMPGTDTLSFDSGDVWLLDENYADCSENGCFGGTDNKAPPTPWRRKIITPTATATLRPTLTPTPEQPSPTVESSPTPTPTMFGGPGGIRVKPPQTGGDPAGGDFSWALPAAVLAAAAGVGAFAGGFKLARGSRG